MPMGRINKGEAAILKIRPFTRNPELQFGELHNNIAATDLNPWLKDKL